MQRSRRFILVVQQLNINGFSYLVSGCGKLRFASFWLFSFQDAQRRPWTLTRQPGGRSRGVLSAALQRLQRAVANACATPRVR